MKTSYPKIETELVPQKVNLNGTSKNALIADYLAVIRAITKLQDAMGRATPHGRDYQTHSDLYALGKARKAWNERRLWLEELSSDIHHAAEMVIGQE
jgi:hypothetical protein